MKIVIHYISINAGIDRATTGKVNFNNSACSKARKKIQTATGMFVGSAVSIVILQKVRNVNRTRKSKYVQLHKFKKRLFSKEWTCSFFWKWRASDARLSRVHDASITLPCYSMRLTNLNASDARHTRVWRAWKTPSLAVAVLLALSTN